MTDVVAAAVRVDWGRKAVRGRWLRALGIQAVLMGFVAAVFWWNEQRYRTPTPKPANLRQPAIGEWLPVQAEVRGTDRRPLPRILNFVNPDCACSRFAFEHLRELLDAYEHEVAFVIVLEQTPGRPATALPGDLRARAQVVVDRTGELAWRCGVYSTPQAVLVSPEGMLLFRGNYNVNRYCADLETAYVFQALARMTRGLPLSAPPAEASVAYGCPLPRLCGAK